MLGFRVLRIPHDLRPVFVCGERGTAISQAPAPVSIGAAASALSPTPTLRDLVRLCLQLHGHANGNQSHTL